MIPSAPAALALSMARQLVNVPRNLAGIGSHSASSDGLAKSASRQFLPLSVMLPVFGRRLSRRHCDQYSFDTTGRASLPAAMQYRACSPGRVFAVIDVSHFVCCCMSPFSRYHARLGAKLLAAWACAPRLLEWADLAEVRLRLDRCPQRRSATSFPCRLQRHSSRKTNKLPTCRPPLRFGRKRCGAMRPRPVIAIEVAMVAARTTERRVTTMATIGTFTKTENDYTGAVKTLTLNVKARISPVEKANDKAPDFRIFAGQTEFGAAWKKKSNEGREYLSLKLDDPSFPAPIYASLVEIEGEDSLSLIWSRRTGD